MNIKLFIFIFISLTLLFFGVVIGSNKFPQKGRLIEVIDFQNYKVLKSETTLFYKDQECMWLLKRKIGGAKKILDFTEYKSQLGIDLNNERRTEVKYANNFAGDLFTFPDSSQTDAFYFMDNPTKTPSFKVVQSPDGDFVFISKVNK